MRRQADDHASADRLDPELAQSPPELVDAAAELARDEIEPLSLLDELEKQIRLFVGPSRLLHHGDPAVASREEDGTGGIPANATASPSP
jgi:hypothetical protein